MTSLEHDISMQRTSVNLDEAVYRRVKALARERGKSMARVIEELLRRALGDGEQREVSAPPLHQGNGPRLGIDISDRDRLGDVMDGR